MNLSMTRLGLCVAGAILVFIGIEVLSVGTAYPLFLGGDFFILGIIVIGGGVTLVGLGGDLRPHREVLTR